MSDIFILPDTAPESLRNFSSAFEPFSEKSLKGSELRRQEFSTYADSNGSGHVSLAEMDGFIRSVLKRKYQNYVKDKGRDEIMNEDEGERLFRLFRPCYIHAFNNAKTLKSDDLAGGDHGSTKNLSPSNDYIEFSEFRVFTIYLRIYAAMFDIFITIDGVGEGRTKDDDARISLYEFLVQYKDLDKYGFKALQGVTSRGKAAKVFDEIDTNDGGFILFSEWSNFIKKGEIVAKTKLGILLSGNLKARHVGGGTPKKAIRPMTASPEKKIHWTSIRNEAAGYNSANHGARKVTPVRVPVSTNKKFQLAMPSKVAGAYKPRHGASPQLKKFIKSFQPYAEKDSTSLALRKTGFASCDNNGTGQCSLAEIDSFINFVLKNDYGRREGTMIFKRFRAAYIHAYNRAKDLKTHCSTGSDHDYVSFPEFRILNAYLCIYAAMLDCFQMVDGNGAGIDANDDRRVEKNEWIEGYTEFKNSGFVALARVKSEESALAAFNVMDADGQGVVRFIEFCDWIRDAEISNSTSLGRLLQGSALKIEKLAVCG